jgi:hypothetical protein
MHLIMDISDTLAPTSEQLDAVDLLGGPRTFTVDRVSKGNVEQPVQVHLAEFPRPWRPGKSMRRVLAATWGTDASAWVGRRLTLWCDPRVKFGGEEVGGVRISHMSHIEGRKRIPLLVTRGKSATYTVEPLRESPPPAAVSSETLAEMEELFTEAGIPEEQRLPGVNQIIGGTAMSLEMITEDQARTVLVSLRKKVGR